MNDNHFLVHFTLFFVCLLPSICYCKITDGKDCLGEVSLKITFSCDFKSGLLLTPAFAQKVNWTIISAITSQSLRSSSERFCIRLQDELAYLSLGS